MERLVIERVAAINLHDIMPLVLESDREGYRFLRRLHDDYASGANRFDGEGEALFTAQLGNQIVGMCGLNQDPYAADRHVGRLRRLYVHPDFRRYGIGKQLVSRAIEEAKRFFEVVTLRTDNPSADAFYRAIGFLADPLYHNATHYLRLEERSDG
ncbi:MAG: GNAT family N-acetyltransferase [Alicyclobacillus sp.]|nr:GNAT family N-acetyltransferase [Alicyclobacillus sp.]